MLHTKIICIHKTSLQPVLLFFLLFGIIGIVKGQSNLNVDPGLHQPKKTKGFAIGGTPILAYDADLGIRYGAVLNLFDYGKGECFPNYLQYAYLKLFHTSKGTSNFSLVFDSERIIPSLKLLFEVTYTNDIALDFFGFNGEQAYVNRNYIEPGQDQFRNKFFYSHSRNLMRMRLDLQKKMYANHLRFYVGASYNIYKIAGPNWQKLGLPRSNSGTETESLYKQYVEQHIISANEKNGGIVPYFSAGAIYDSRDNTINCKNGTWIESYVLYSVGSKSSSSFAKHILNFRQYLNLPGSMVLFYRFSSQQKISGDIPFYFLPVFADTRQNHDGIGGAFTARGISRNRIAADGFLLANMELRKRVASLRFLNLNWDIELSAFTDASYVTQEYRFNRNLISPEQQTGFFSGEPQSINYTFGPGLYLIYNVNNIISFNYGFSPNKQLGSGGFYVGSGFLF